MSFRRRKIGSCPKGCASFAYDLPVRLDESILPFLEGFGKPAFPLRATGMLKIHRPDCSITGIRRLREIRIMLGKDADQESLVSEFEKALSAWLAAEQAGEKENG